MNKTYYIHINEVFHRQRDNIDMVCLEINTILVGKEIKIMDLVFDEKNHLFKNRYILGKYKKFNYAGKARSKDGISEEEYFIRFDYDCFIKIKKGLTIEYRNIFYEN